jgi:hypothetical protein
MLARPEGLEPPAYWFEANRSIQLSYGRVVSIPTNLACLLEVWDHEFSSVGCGYPTA